MSARGIEGTLAQLQLVLMPAVCPLLCVSHARQIASVALVGPSAGLPARASSGRPRPRADDLIAGTDFLSVFIGSALPRTPQQVAKSSKARNRDSTTAPEDIGFGARLAPKSSTTTTTVTTAGATPTPFGATTEAPLPGLSTRQQHYSSTYSNPPPESDSETLQTSTEPTQRIEDSASELHYRTYPPQDTHTASDVTLPPDSSISVVTDIVTSKQELISLTAGDPTDGDQHASDGVLSASRITSFYVQHQDDNARSVQHHNTEYHSPHQTSTNGGYQSNSPHSSVPNPTVHYQSSTAHSAETGSPFHSSVGTSPSYHTVTLHGQPQDHSYQGHSTVFPQSTSNSWYSSHPTQATQIVVNHPGLPTPRPETSTVQQVISVRVSSSVVQGPSSPPNTARSKPFAASRLSDPPFHHRSESSSHNNVISGQTEDEGARQHSHTLPASAQASQERAVEDQQQVVPTSLVTEEQPAATAVQRSQFSVEESSPSDISALHVQRDHHQTRQSYRDDGSDQTIATVVEVPASSVVNYESRVSSPTSNSRIQFYSGPPPSQPEPVRRHGWTPQRGRKSFGHQGLQQQQQQQQQQDQQQHQVQQSQQQPQQQQDQQRQAHHQQRHSEPAENNYEQPEQNYEVDEQVSVVTNGRAHGIQHQDVPHTTQSSPALASAPDNQQVDSAGHNGGYVVEGGGVRKYRVEQRTPDGFIVGEYGVVNSEGDPLRAVRYTADGTAPTKLIDQALSHFLSL